MPLEHDPSLPSPALSRALRPCSCIRMTICCPHTHASDYDSARAHAIFTYAHAHALAHEHAHAHANSVHPTNQHGWTALHHAANWGYIDCVKKLLDLGADPYAQSESGKTPMEVLGFGVWGLVLGPLIFSVLGLGSKEVLWFRQWRS